MNCIADEYAKQIKRFLTLFNESRDFKVAKIEENPTGGDAGMSKDSNLVR